MGKLTEGYNSTKSGGKYFKMSALDTGNKRLRLLNASDAFTGYERWTAEKKPLRAKDLAELLSMKPACGWKLEEKGTRKGEEEQPKFFALFAAYNYADKGICVLQVTQSGLFKAIEKYEENEDYGSCTGYDVTLSRTKKDNGFYEYDLVASPPKPLPKEVAEEWAALESEWTGLAAMYSGGDPFKPFSESVPF